MKADQFIFRDKVYSCNIWIGKRPEIPFYVFIDLLDKELIDEFGSEVTIKTDFETCLPRRTDYPSMLTLEHAIFKAVQNDPEFISTRSSFRSRMLRSSSKRLI